MVRFRFSRAILLRSSAVIYKVAVWTEDHDRYQAIGSLCKNLRLISLLCSGRSPYGKRENANRDHRGSCGVLEFVPI